MTDKPAGRQTGPARDRNDDVELPPLPDGGLAASFPDWLRSRPAWSEPLHATGEWELPAPDTSPIDPRHLVADKDLPTWLRAVADRTLTTDLPNLPDDPVVPHPTATERAEDSAIVAVEAVEAQAPAPAEESVPEVPPMPSSFNETVPVGANEATSPAAAKPDVAPEVRQWLTRGEPVEPERPWYRDPIILILVLAAMVIIVAAIILL